ncbi:MAG: hypothetical protein IKB16_05425 [Lentisphaeria bacterium]|nr:hypothetical protein [Lentisphaeria bacterium]
MNEIQKTEISENLVTDLKQIILQARQGAYAAVNACMISAYWKIGQRIVEEKLNVRTSSDLPENKPCKGGKSQTAQGERSVTLG